MKTSVLFSLCLLLVSTAAESQWHSLGAPLPQSYYGGAFGDTMTAYLSAWGNGNVTIFKSTDGGMHFKDIWGVVDDYFLFGVSSISKDVAYVAGYDPTCGCALLMQSFDGGDNWNNINFSSSLGLYAVKQLGVDTIVACGFNGLIIKTVNAGKFWKAADTGNDTLVYRYLNFPNAMTGYAAGGFIPSLADKIYKSTDGGLSWSLLKDFDQTRSIGGLKFLDDRTGFYAGSDGQDAIYKTVDGGNSWKRVYEGTDSSVFIAIDFHDNNTGYAVNQNGRIVKSTDGGESWKTDYYNKDQVFTMMALSPDGKELVGGQNGVLFINTPQESVYIPSSEREMVAGIDAGKVLHLAEDAGMNSIAIYDNLGRKVLQKDLQGQHEVSMASLSNGVYFWEGVSEGNKQMGHGKLLIN